MSDILYEAAKEAILAVARDTSVSLEDVLSNLLGLQDELGMSIDAIEQDISAKERREEHDDE